MFQDYIRMGAYIVAEDLVPGEAYLKLLPINTRNDAETSWELESETFLPNGEKVDTSSYIEALWLNVDSNRLTPPNVTAGSVVIVYRSKVGDEYYWREESTQLNRRKLEEVTYRLSNRPEGYESTPDTPLELANYTLTMSTLNQVFSLVTSKNNNEICSTAFNLDLGRGVVLFKDSIGNKRFFNMGKGEHSIILVKSHNLDVPDQVELIGNSVTMYNMGGSIRMTDKDEIIEITGNRGEKIKNVEQDIESLKQHIGTIEAKIKSLTVSVNEFNINTINIGETKVKTEPIKVGLFNEAKDKVLEHFQTILDLDKPKSENGDEGDDEKREKVESEEHEKVDDPKTTSFTADVKETIKMTTKQDFKVEATGAIGFTTKQDFKVDAMTGCTLMSKAPIEIKGPTSSVGAILDEIAQTLMKANLDPVAGNGAPLSSPNLIAGIPKIIALIKANFK